MTVLKSLGVIAVLATTITAPVLARDARPGHLAVHGSHHHFRDAYNQRDERFDLNRQSQRNTENSIRGPDHSRIGGEDPDLHPSAY